MPDRSIVTASNNGSNTFDGGMPARSATLVIVGTNTAALGLSSTLPAVTRVVRSSPRVVDARRRMFERLR
ncbi:hypothetical protein ACFQRB_19160 [Halobaculum litoreum]|uniref:Uncharacterized protein n=1 Tax=Halobaculum litoreum TaxID=3031998 RepID=A0ABD5XSA9_9EURY